MARRGRASASSRMKQRLLVSICWSFMPATGYRRMRCYFYAQALQQDDLPDMLYADEDHLDSEGSRTMPLFKPGWSPELLLSTMYLGRAMLYRGAGCRPGRHASLTCVIFRECFITGRTRHPPEQRRRNTPRQRIRV